VSQFGVSALHWSDDLTQVVECRVHTLEEVDGLLWLTGGIAYPVAHSAEVAAVGEDQVWFLLNDAEVSPESSPRWSFKIR
jgi:hypothetical protein